MAGSHSGGHLVDTAPLPCRHGENVVTDALQRSRPVIVRDILAVAGHRIGQTIERQVIALDQPLQHTGAFLIGDVEVSADQLDNAGDIGSIHAGVLGLPHHVDYTGKAHLV